MATTQTFSGIRGLKVASCPDLKRNNVDILIKIVKNYNTDTHCKFQKPAVKLFTDIGENLNECPHTPSPARRIVILISEAD